MEKGLIIYSLSRRRAHKNIFLDSPLEGLSGAMAPRAK